MEKWMEPFQQGFAAGGPGLVFTVLSVMYFFTVQLPFTAYFGL